MNRIIQILLFDGNQLIALHEDGTLTMALIEPERDSDGFPRWGTLKTLIWRPLENQ